MNNTFFPQYTTDYISGVMSLRKPQKASLKILEEIVNSVNLSKDMNLKAVLGSVHAMYPICSDFERDFMSLTFALATGVGKTRLMGAFIAYLYTQHTIKNFFVVAPNTTIYDKLKSDLSNSGSTKYVFKGLGCFATPPQIITDDDYKERTMSLFESDIHVFIYNIDKFNKEGANMKKVNEVIGDSFYQYLSALPDLVLIMDESHHYRAEKGAQALNELHPLLGLELTATPLVTKGTKQVPFKNVVYEYPLSKAIEDGYTRTPFAVTRSDIDFYNFGDEQLDKMMLLDGITCHESTKRKLEVYATNHGKPVVKPFMLVVCKDTDHATWVESFIKSDEFHNGAYRNKTIIVHDPYLNRIGTEAELASLQHFLVPLMFTQSGTKPMISIDMSSKYVDYYKSLEESDEICVIGFGFNADDEHINGIFRDLVDCKKKPITIVTPQNGESIDTIKKSIARKLKLQDDSNISIILVDKERKRNDVSWIDCLVASIESK